MSEERHPLIFALKHLHVRCPEPPRSPEDIVASARLMQGERELPSADDAEVDAFLARSIEAEPPIPGMIELLKMSFPDWPQTALLALQAATDVGPGADDAAAVNVQQALQLDRNCRLARQLVRLLPNADRVRLPFGTAEEDAPDVVSLLSC